MYDCVERTVIAIFIVGSFLTMTAHLDLFYGHKIMPMVFGFICVVFALFAIAEEISLHNIRKKNANVN
jgi:hypothetical protein